ncbi:MAG TPA: hypothetical protein PLF78_10120 [Caulobacter sp.]|nr:hypothetical protein [Caulobacter sp.]
MASDAAGTATTKADEATAAADGLADLADRTANIADAPNMTIEHGIEGVDELYYAFQDDDENAVLGIDDQLRLVPAGIYLPRDGKMEIGGATLDSDTPYTAASIEAREADWLGATIDLDGNVLTGYRNGDFWLQHAGSTADVEMLGWDQINLAWSAALMARPHNLDICYLTASNPMIADWGQSHGTGTEGNPVVTVAGRSDLYMIGDSVHTASETAAGYTQIGTLALNPFVGTVVSAGVVRDDAWLDAQGTNSSARGETVAVAVGNHLSRAWGPLRPARKFTVASLGVGTKSIEQLSKGAAPELYLRLTEAMTAFDGLATGGDTAELAVVNMLALENNYQQLDGTADYAALKALITTLCDDITADANTIMGGQSGSPAFIFNQPSGGWTRDDVELSVGNAVVDACRETPGLFLAGTIYPVPNKTIADNGVGAAHLSANGYRQLGLKHGQVARRVLIDRLCWEPLSLLWVKQRGRFVYLGFHVPAPPLQFGLPYVGFTATDYPGKGIRVEDADGFMEFASPVAQIGATVIRVECKRTPGADGYVWLGDQTVHGGNTCIHDSDFLRAEYAYSYAARAATATAENIAALVDEPYPLYNWAVNERRPIGWSRLS